jgi:hypothetical protein
MFNMTGGLVLFKLQQARVRREIKQQIKSGIPVAQLHLFILTEDEYRQLDWERREIEFRHQGRMYDVVCRQYSDQRLLLYCVEDTEEALLFAGLDEMIRRKMEEEAGTASKSPAKLFKLLSYFFSGYGNYQLVSTMQKSLFGELFYHYIPPNLKVLTPPPDTY